MKQWRVFYRLLCAVTVLSITAVSSVAADRIVGADFKGTSIELIDILQVVDSNNAEVAIDLPADATGQKIRMNLQATATAKPHRWAVFTLTNPDLVVHDFVLQIPRQGFINSGVLWPKTNATRVISISPSTGPRPIMVGSRNAQSYALTIAAGSTVSFALELTDLVLEKATLWHRNAYEAQAGQMAFFNGVVLGIAFLLGMAILSLFFVRPMAVFPAAGIFAWAAIAFLLINGGFLSLVTSETIEKDYEPAIRALIESMMVVGLSLTLITFLQLQKNAPVFNLGFWLATLTGMGLAVFSFFDAKIASGLARMFFALVVVAGLLTAFVLWRLRSSRAKSSLLVWALAAAWTALAAVGCLGLTESAFLGPAIAAGLGLILITISFALVQLVFGKSIAADHFLEDSGRRALALAGSEQSVWDWQVSSQLLYVGPELERSLGLQSGQMGSVNLHRWYEMIHPSDRGAYASAVEAAERRGKGSFSQEFRLRRANGSYRWYSLRARSIVGDEGHASRLIGTLTDVTAIKRSEASLLSDAVRDRVTGLPNRALFMDRLERAMRRAGTKPVDSETTELFLLVVDLDRFKNVNDGLGHEVGDSLLNVTGERLARMIGPDDTLARLAGDQFGIIFNGEVPHSELIEVADNIRQIVAVPINVRPREIFLTASIGVAQFDDGQTNPEELIKNAEIALYEAKRKGKNQIEFFRTTMRDERSQLVALESDLRRALDRNEFEVVYQPIKRLVDDQLAGFEALVRWRHPELGLLGPEKFLDIAEETGIIREVGRYVLNEAARRLGIWQRAFRPSDPLFVSVNVSRAQLLNYELVSDLRALLSREDIVPGTLKLEVTETLVMQNPELAKKVLERASDLGVGIACDDFGTGYSALANLSRLPFDTLKIDRAFLLEDGVNENATIIFDAITHLAHNLHLNVIAEGVENNEQLQRLQQRGVDYAQGFFIGEPVSSQRVIEALGGQPYTSPDRGTALAQLWGRLVGKEENQVKEDKFDFPTLGEQEREIAEMRRQDGDLQPWSPDSEDVSDPSVATPVDDLVWPVEENDDATIATEPASVPEVGASPLAPRVEATPSSAKDKSEPQPGSDRATASETPEPVDGDQVSKKAKPAKKKKVRHKPRKKSKRATKAKKASGKTKTAPGRVKKAAARKSASLKRRRSAAKRRRSPGDKKS